MTTNSWVAKNVSSADYFTNREESQQLGTVNSSLDSALLAWSEFGSRFKESLLLSWRLHKLEGVLVESLKLLCGWWSQTFVLGNYLADFSSNLTPVKSPASELVGLVYGAINEGGSFGDDSRHGEVADGIGGCVKSYNEYQKPLDK